MANKLILNYNHEFTIDTYSRNTTYDEQSGLSSYANVTFPDNSCYAELTMLCGEMITDIIIASMDGTSIYHLANQDARITSIYESLMSEEKVSVSATIQFEAADEEEAQQ